MKKSFAFIALLLPIISFSQAFQVGHMSINFKDPSRSGGFSIAGAIQMPGTGRDIGTEIYYPATSAGNNVALASGQFPVVVIGHGFVMTYDNYDNIYNQLASLGFIVALPRTEGGFSPNHLEFAKDITLLADLVKQLNTLNTPTNIAIFNGKVKQSVAIGGHSMGAGCSMVAAQNNSTITALFNMATATSNTAGVSSLAGANLVTVPTLIFSGEKDCVADTVVQNNHYNNLAAVNKFHVILKALTHCDFGNGTSTNCTFGQSVSGCGNTLSNALAFNRYMNYLVPFLNRTLKDSCSEGQRFMDSVNTNSSLRAGIKILGSMACAPQSIYTISSEGEIKLYPNPTRELFYIENYNSSLINELVVTDLQGKIILNEKYIPLKNNKYIVDVKTLQKGIYILKVVMSNKITYQKFVKE